MKFSYGDWVYLTDDLSDSVYLNAPYKAMTVRAKAGRRLKVAGGNSFMRYLYGQRANTSTPGYLISGICVAEHEVMSCEEHRLLSQNVSDAFHKSVTSLL